MKHSKILFSFILVLTLVQLTSALLGTYQKESDINLIQTCNNCTYCNITSAKYPNGTTILNNVEMTKDGTFYNYTLISNYTEAIGTYTYYYDCGNSIESVTGGINFEVTLSGDETPENVSTILGIIVIVVFGISCVFLYLSNQMQTPGTKIFFLLASFVFMIGSLLTASIVAFDSNLTQGVNNTITVMLFAFGLIFFVIFAYIMIQQTIAAMDMMRKNKGYEVGY